MSSNRKKILILSRYHHTEIGGVERYVSHLIDTFTYCDYEVYESNMYLKKSISSQQYIYIYRGKYKYIDNSVFADNDVSKYSLVKTIFQYLSWKRKIRKFIKKEGIDIVIDNSFRSTISFVKGVKYIWIQHINLDWYSNRYLGYLNKNVIYKFFFKMCMSLLGIKERNKYHKVVVYTDVDRDIFMNIFSISEDNGQIVPICLSNKNKQELLSIKQSILSNKNKPSEIVFVGRLEEQKNVAFIKELQEKANSTNNNLTIHIYGDGSQKNILSNIKGLILHSSVSPDKTHLVWNEAKLMILPSKFEGFSFSIVEALSNGVPCIIANSFYNAKFLINDKRGKLVNSFETSAWLEAINSIFFSSESEYLKYRLDAIDFAYNNLSNDDFRLKWIDLISTC